MAASLLSQEAVPVTIGVEGPQITEAQSKDSGASPHLTEGSTVAQTKDSENDVPSTEAGKIAV